MENVLILLIIFWVIYLFRRSPSHSDDTQSYQISNAPLTKSQKNKINYFYKENGASLDKLIHDLIIQLDDSIKKIQVHGINQEPRSPDHECFMRMKGKPEIQGAIKRYWIRLLVKPTHFQFKTLNHYRYRLGKRKSSMQTADYRNFYKGANERNRMKASSQLEPIFRKHPGRFGVAVSFGKSAYITIGAELAISSIDLIQHGASNKALTKVGTANIYKVADMMNEILIVKSIMADTLYEKENEILKYELIRESENKFREEEGLPLVGEGYVEETRLYYLVQTEFPDATREHSPKWLGRQRIDIYIPSKNIGIEYQGEQHFRPIDWFGGDEGFSNQQERDERKRSICKANGLRLVEWTFREEICKDKLFEKLSAI